MARSVGICLAGLGCRGSSWVIAGESPDPADAGARLERDASATEICPTTAALDAQRAAANPTPSVDARHAGLWRGTLGGGAAAGFPSGDVELRIVDGGQNSLRFGASASAPSSLDPSRGYLCTESSDGVGCATRSGFVGGFAYPLESVVSRGEVLSFRMVGSDPWGPWCRLQAPLAWPDQTQPCGSAFGVGPVGSDTVGAAGCARVAEDGLAVAIDCELMYSLQRCRCAADACVAEYADILEVGLKLTDGLLGGSLWYADGFAAATVSFARP